MAAEARRCFDIWGYGQLYELVGVRFSNRMFRSVGRCYPTERLITLASPLRDLGQDDVLEVLCHELAHLVAYEKHGRMIKPHGPEWRALMLAINRPPRVRCDNPEILKRLAAVRPKRKRYLHVCTVCRAERIANRRMERWRCGNCYEPGGSGELRIIELGSA